MTTSALETTHSRFYVFRHKTENGIQTIEYLSVSEKWSEFQTAWLIADINAARWIANDRMKLCPYYDFTYCVGKVFVELDNHFEIQTI